MKVINLWAGPGAGKSTTAAGLFARMKNAGKRVELVTERAKELVYEGNPTINNQLLLLGEQDQRLRRLIGKVDYAITDTPLPLGILYAQPPFDSEWFANASINLFNTYNNFNVFIERVKPYAEYGRTQTEDEARRLDKAVRNLMTKYGIGHWSVFGSEDAAEAISNTTKGRL